MARGCVARQKDKMKQYKGVRGVNMAKVVAVKERVG